MLPAVFLREFSGGKDKGTPCGIMDCIFVCRAEAWNGFDSALRLWECKDFCKTGTDPVHPDHSCSVLLQGGRKNKGLPCGRFSCNRRVQLFSGI